MARKYIASSHGPDQQIISERKSKAQNTEWRTIAVKVRAGELPLLNRQLARFNYNTLGRLDSALMQNQY